MATDMALVCQWCFLVIAILTTEVHGDDLEVDEVLNTTSEDPLPAHSMHRLIPSVLDMVTHFDNVTSQSSSGNMSDNVPFLPSGMLPSYRNLQPYRLDSSNPTNTRSTNFTPSYFIGEVIPEPYIPERFHNTRPVQIKRNSTYRSFQKLLPSQTALAFNKILPFIENMKEAVPNLSEHSYEEDRSHFQHHVPPVHEPSVEDDDMTTPKYSVNYGDNDEHLDRPSHLLYYIKGGQQDLMPTKPITFVDNQKEHPHSSHQEYFHQHDYRGNADDNFMHSNTFSSHSDPYKDHKHHNSDATDLTYGHNVPHHEDYLNPHIHHHETDFILPSPFYPPESEYSKDAHYKVYPNKSKNPLHGLLHFAAALIPLGLLVAALQPNVMHVNSSQPMPNKQRSEDVALPGLEALGADHAACERKAFCELAVLGGRPEGSTAHQGLWKLANSISEKDAASMGLTEILKAVKSNSCASLKCVPLR